jgi:hypothetical protein
MFDESLRLAAAAYAARWVSGDDLKKAASRALDRGVYSHSLGELATLPNPILSDAGPLLESAFRELGMAIPSRQEACMIATVGCIHAILEGVVAPEAGIKKLHDCAFEEVFHCRNADRANCDPLREAVVLHYEFDHYDERLSRDAVDEIESRVLALAAAWNRNYGFRPLDPTWLTWNNAIVPAIARHIYDDRAFHDLPFLADALEDAGCTDPDILGHCRSGGEHVRGCWVVDLILGKE